MEPDVEAVQQQFGSGVTGTKPGGMGFEFDDIQGLITASPEADGSSFTALLGLPPPQAVELLVKEDYPAKPTPPPVFPSNVALIDRASMFSVFAPADYQPESTDFLPASGSMKIEAVKEEPLELEHPPNSSSPADSDQSLKSNKRKVMETKVI